MQMYFCSGEFRKREFVWHVLRTVWKKENDVGLYTHQSFSSSPKKREKTRVSRVCIPQGGQIRIKRAKIALKADRKPIERHPLKILILVSTTCKPANPRSALQAASQGGLFLGKPANRSGGRCDYSKTRDWPLTPIQAKKRLFMHFCKTR
jgi:hypothetical protein